MRISDWSSDVCSSDLDERVADAKPTQIDRTDVAAREIAARLAVAAVERLVAHLRDRAQKIIARDRSGRRNLILADDGYGEGFGDLGAGDAAARDDDFLAARRRLRPGRSVGLRGLPLRPGVLRDAHPDHASGRRNLILEPT